MPTQVLDVVLEAFLHRLKCRLAAAIGSAILSAPVKCRSGRTLSLKLAARVVAKAVWLFLRPLVGVVRVTKNARVLR